MLQNKSTTIAGLLLASVFATLTPLAVGEGFDSICSWVAYDPGAHGVGDDPDGYHGAVFDGRYIYFVPYQNEGIQYHGEVLRLDTWGRFSDAASWTTYDPGAHGVGDHPVGYASGVFDGRYVYFVPWSDNSGFHGEVLRYDTTAPFAEVSSWVAFDAGANGVGTDPDGYRGAVFDGQQYVYFVPTYNGTQFHGEVLRLDITGDFSDVSSWSTFDPGGHGVGYDADGYSYAGFDGRYIYFGPYLNGVEYHGEVMRYDTTGDFSSATSWTTFDPGSHGVGNDPDGYPGVIFDGRYMYFVPFNNGTDYHGEVLRYDTLGDFSDVASWVAFDTMEHGIGDNTTGYVGGVFDGRYVYFVPFHNADGNADEALRYDTYGPFSDASSWLAFNPALYGVGSENHGYRECGFDGKYIYYAPAGVYTDHGEVLRFSTTGCTGDFDGDWDVDLDDYTTFADCFTGPDAGPIEPECEPGDADGDADIDCDDWAEFLLSWSEPGTPPFLADCPVWSPLPEDSLGVGCTDDGDCDGEARCVQGVCYVPKARYLSIARHPDQAPDTARRVRLDTGALIGWVGGPYFVSPTSQHSGLWLAELQDTPHYEAYWPEVVHVTGCGVAHASMCDVSGMHCDPNSCPTGETCVHHSYEIQAIALGQDIADEGSYSEVLQLHTPSTWGDTVSTCAGGQCKPPNGVVGLDDVQAAIKLYQGSPVAPVIWLDIDPSNGIQTPNQNIGIGDILKVIDGFQSKPYPGDGPLDCP